MSKAVTPSVEKVEKIQTSLSHREREQAFKLRRGDKPSKTVHLLFLQSTKLQRALERKSKKAGILS